MNFRLKYVFGLLLLIGIGLMWWKWATHENITANQLLLAKEKADNVTQRISNLDSRGVTDQALIEFLELGPWARQEEWIGSPFSFSRGLTIWVEADWLPEPVEFYWEIDSESFTTLDEAPRPKPQTPVKPFEVIWTADWQAIEARATHDIRLFWVQVSITVLALLGVVWGVWW